MDLTELHRQSAPLLQRHPWEQTRARVMFFLLSHRLPFRHLADIGSGDGFVLRFLQKRGAAASYSAIDPNYTETLIQAIARDTAPQTSFKQYLPEAPADPPADLVLLLDVLEHCEDDQAMLHHALTSPFVDPGATVMITVPAFQSLFSQHDRLLGHCRRYSRRQLEALCKRNNLHIQRSGYFFFSLLPARMLARWAEQLTWRRTTHGVDNWNGSSWATKLISLILWIDFRVGYALSSIGIHLPGLSCYCLCQKSRS